MGVLRCYLVVENQEEAMPHISRIFVGCFGLVVWAIGVPIAAAAVNLDALFLGKAQLGYRSALFRDCKFCRS